MTTCKVDPKDKKSSFVFHADSGKSWLINISTDGIKFNHAEYPNIAPDGFAKAFCDILEKNYIVKFEKRES